jgi:GDP-D-mannose 3',5'-epimerase
MKNALVLGAGGFIGSHMVKRLIREGYHVTGADLKEPEFNKTAANSFFIGDLRDPLFVSKLIPEHGEPYLEIYQYAADMGGAGFVFTGEHDADIMHNSALINLNVLNSLRAQKDKATASFPTKIFYSGSACMYPEHNQLDPENPNLEESSAYPANPDSEYGWEKLFSERLYEAYSRNYGINVAIGRFHNIYGPEGTWQGGREKAPAAICRKVILASPENPAVEIWGDGKQTRSFLYIDDCIEATRRLMASNFSKPINIGSEEMVTIKQLVELAAKIESKEIKMVCLLNGPTGVRGRNSDNRLIRSVLGWDYEVSLESGLKKTYFWIKDQILRSSH